MTRAAGGRSASTDIDAITLASRSVHLDGSDSSMPPRRWHVGPRLCVPGLDRAARERSSNDSVFSSSHPAMYLHLPRTSAAGQVIASISLVLAFVLQDTSRSRHAGRASVIAARSHEVHVYEQSSRQMVASHCLSVAPTGSAATFTEAVSELSPRKV
ncbi:hypothetical protein BD310DRAFT_429599 [Dichomitus squalens]|uniref:Uncharacterized protein n=1 Tax=Dichomitus squalens TaxID=114155 RepID=A0A4Q9PWP4_9APHY|nr:hypothetical protein BD310DRAFT_429599 [Dichomitus squalens]